MELMIFHTLLSSPRMSVSCNEGRCYNAPDVEDRAFMLLIGLILVIFLLFLAWSGIRSLFGG